MMSFSPSVVAKSVRLVLGVSLIGLVVAAIVVGHHFEQRGEHILSVQTASMVPLFRPGDAIIVQRTALNQLKAGDIVSYRSLSDPRILISHRIIAIDVRHARLTTKGDRLQRPDPEIPSQAVIGRVEAVAPGLGQLFAWVRKPLGLVVLVYLPALLLITSQLQKLLRNHQAVCYRTIGYRPDGRA